MMRRTNGNRSIAMITLIFAGTLCTVTRASLESCRLALGEMHDRSKALERASTMMWAQYEYTCQASEICEVRGVLSKGSIDLNFRELRGTNDYTELRKACLAFGTAEEPATLCKVDTEMSLQNGKFPYTVRKEPVCFPYQCAEKQVSLVETLPMGCDPSSETCDITSQVADCGADRPKSAGTGRCKENAAKMAEDVDISQIKAKLVVDAEKHCEGVSDENPGNNKICTFNKASIDTVVTENFRPFRETPAYRSYMNQCYAAGGMACFLSLTMKLSGNIYYDIDAFGDYNDVPGCFPDACNIDDARAVMQDRVKKIMGQKISNSINNSILGGRRQRRLREVEFVFAERAARRRTTDESCPLGMSDCTTTVVDFYCSKEDGVIIEAMPAETSATDRTQSNGDATTASDAFAMPGSFIAVVVVSTMSLWVALL